jgi:VanZ family protein
MLARWITLTQRRWVFWACVAAVLFLALAKPGHHLPTTGWDKANHALAFAVLAVLGGIAYPGRLVRVLVALLAYGALIEVLQSFTRYRSGEWLDLLADGIGLLLAWPVARRLAQPAATFPAPRTPPER